MQAEREWSEIFKRKKSAPTLISVYSEIVFKRRDKDPQTNKIEGIWIQSLTGKSVPTCKTHAHRIYMQILHPLQKLTKNGS